MHTKFIKAIPVLPCQNIDESINFYENKLGFKAIKYGDMAILERDNLVIHLWLTQDKYLSENSSCYIRVTGIEQIYKEYEENKVIHPNGKLEIKPWGMKEFVVLDNSGNGLNFGESISD
jgi:catechol 2,3-dioxygenase-like lactoylglutathione lyase family enzyme